MQLTKLCVRDERNGPVIVINSPAIYKLWSRPVPAVASRLITLATVLAAIVALGAPLTAYAAAPAPFSAVYNARYDGLPLKAKAVRELRVGERGQLEFTSTASAFFTRIRESSTFRWSDAGPVPSHYAYERKGLGKNRRADVRFDWATGTAANIAKRKPWSLQVLPGTLDKLAVQIKLRADVRQLIARGESGPLVYHIVENGRLKRFEFELSGQESIETPLGPLDTVKLRRVRAADSKRETVFWLAPAHDFLLVKMFQQERNGTKFELEIRSLEQGEAQG